MWLLAPIPSKTVGVEAPTASILTFGPVLEVKTLLTKLILIIKHSDKKIIFKSMLGLKD